MNSILFPFILVPAASCIFIEKGCFLVVRFIRVSTIVFLGHRSHLEIHVGDAIIVGFRVNGDIFKVFVGLARGLFRAFKIILVIFVKGNPCSLLVPISA